MKSQNHAALAAGVVLSVCLAGCGVRETPEQSMAAAKESLAKHERRTAVIHLKNALQKAPNSSAARLLLGHTLLDLGDGIGAVVELDKAAEAGAPEAEVAPLRARAMVLLDQFDRVLERYGDVSLSDAQAMADLRCSVAAAQFYLNRKAAAEVTLAEALKLAPQLGRAVLLKARMRGMAGDMATAMALADEVLKRDGTDPEALQLKGDLLALKGGNAARSQAVQVYRAALATAPGLLHAHAGILWIQLGAGDLEAAQKQLLELRRVYPAHAQTQFFAAMVAMEKGDLKAAREQTAALLKQASDDPRALHVAAALDLKQGRLLQAQSKLNKALKAAPDQAPSRVLLAQVLLRAGDARKALAILQPLLGDSSKDVSALETAAQACLLLGESEQANGYFKQVTQIDPQEPRSRTALALALMDKGQRQQGEDVLTQIAQSDPTEVADLALINLYMTTRNDDKALLAIERLSKKRSGHALAAMLRGRILYRQGHQAEAREGVEALLKSEPLNLPAVSLLASWDMAEGKSAQAKKRFQAVLEKGGRNVAVEMALFDLIRRGGASYAEQVEVLTGVVKRFPTDWEPWQALIMVNLQLRAADKALVAAQSAVAALPDSIELIEALGKAEFAAGAIHQAQGTYTRLAALQPESPHPLMLLADLQMSQRDLNGARQSLRRALALKPDLLPAQRGLMLLELNAGRAKEAREIVAQVKAQRADMVGVLMEGDVEAVLQNWGAAIAAYKFAFNKQPSTEVAIKLHQSLTAAKRTAEASMLVQQWTSAHEGDAAFHVYLGDLFTAQGKPNDARAQYRKVVSLQRDNAAALNNLAWLLSRDATAAALNEAEQMAQRAVAADRTQAEYWDTLAQIQQAQGATSLALESQKHALALQPGDFQLRLNYAKLLIAAGDLKQAKALLVDLSQAGPKPDRHEEVGRLLKQL